MRIALVRPTYGSRFQVNPPLPLGYLASSLRQAGCTDNALVDGSLDMLSPAQAVDAVLNGSQPALVGLQVYTGAHAWTKDFIALLKAQAPGIPIVVGGPHITALKGLALDYLGADYGVMGEGEHSIVQLAQLIEGKISDPAEVHGLIYGKPGDWHHAKEMFGFFREVNDIPFPDWDLLRPERYFPYLEGASMPLRGKHPCTILTSRGCPYKCTFCSSGLTNKRVMRYRTPRNIVDEIKHLRDRHGVDEIFFVDDNLTMSLPRAEQIFDLLIEEEVGIHWRAPNGIRIDRLTDPMIEKMARSGGYYLGVGVETGNPEVMRRIKKHLDLNTVKDRVRKLRKKKIAVSGFFMCGLIDETEEEMEDTLRFALSIPFDRAQMSNYIPYPGSEDFDTIFQSNDPAEFEERVMEFQRNDTIPPFPSVSLEKSIAFQKRFIKRFYLRPRIFWSMLVHFRLSQLKAILQHPWIRRWFDRKATWYDNQ